MALPVPPPSPVLFEPGLQSDFARLLSQKSGSAEFQKLMNRPLSSSVEAAQIDDFTRLIGKDFKPRGGAYGGATSMPEAEAAGVVEGVAFLGVMLAEMSIAMIGEVIRQNRELGTSPEWLEWLLALRQEFLVDNDPYAQGAAETGEQQRRFCCEEIAEIGKRHCRKVQRDMEDRGLLSDDSGKRYLRNASSRAN